LRDKPLKLPPDTYIEHAIKGRIRLRIASQKRNPTFFINLKKEWEGYSGIERIKANPLSASVILYYQKLPQEVVDAIPFQEGLATGAVGRKKDTVFQQVRAVFHRTDRRLQQFTNGELDLPALTFIALVVVGLYQISRKNFTAPAWYTAFWYALNILLKTKE
jgi:hypothetical protein